MVYMESTRYLDFIRCILNVTYAVLFFFKNQHICIANYILFNLELMRKLRYPLGVMQGSAWIFFKIILRGAKVRKRVWELLLGVRCQHSCLTRDGLLPSLLPAV